VPPIKPIAPAPLSGSAKKETAKVPASTTGPKNIPQATVQLTPPSKSVAGTSSITVASTESAASGDLDPILGIAALVLALASFGVQVWMFIS